MKNIVTMIVTAILGAVTLSIIMAVSGRMNRSMEIKSSLPSVIEQTVDNMSVSKKYRMNHRAEYVSDFIENLSVTLDSEADIAVEIRKADSEMGVLSIRVTEEFQHPNGKKGIADCERTVILSQTEDPEQKSYQVRFYMTREDMLADKNCYKKCIIYEGEQVPFLLDTNVDGKIFAGWKDMNDYMADFSVPADQDMVYYADWR